MEKKPRKWTSKRLNDKKEELGIVTNPPPIIEEKLNSSDSNENKPKIRKNYDKTKKFEKPNRYDDNKKNSFNSKSRFNNANRKKHVIKISNLPKDIEVKELYSLISPWGEIGNINIKQYSDVICCYVDFFNVDEAQYFINALDTTPFDCMIIHVQLMNFDK